MADFKDTPLFRTIVDILPFRQLMNPSDGFVFLGSCFAQNVGERFVEYGLSALVNPLGTLYNPFSLSQVLSQTVSPDIEPYVFDAGGVYRCWLAGTRFQTSSALSCMQEVEHGLSELRSALCSSRYLFVTLGTSVIYRLKDAGFVVNNCHRMPQRFFSEEWQDVPACRDALESVVELARSLRPDIQVVFTVSPYRYAKYGFHRSRLAKSVLLLAVDEICHRHPDCCTYFPSYEILLDELRDYRFYGADMIHPSPEAVDYIWHRLVQAGFSSDAINYLREYESVRRGLMHRPMCSDSPQEKARVQQLFQRRDNLYARYSIRPLPKV